MALGHSYPTRLGQLCEANNVGLTYNELLEKGEKVLRI